jgi:hypothetical protein
MCVINNSTTEIKSIPLDMADTEEVGEEFWADSCEDDDNDWLYNNDDEELE